MLDEERTISTKHILITGGMGFIGSTLALALQKKNYHLTLFDLCDNNKNNKFYSQFDNIEFVQGDTNNTEQLIKLLHTKNFDGVIHLAAVSRVVIAQNNPNECIRTNVYGSQSLLNALNTVNYEKKPWLIFGSSREVYGEPRTLPVKESFEKKFVNIYGDSKIQGEKMFIDFAKTHKVSCIILRFSNVYGNQFDLLDRVIPRFIKAIAYNNELTIEGGGQTIDFTHIDDTVDTIIKAIEHIEHNDLVLDDFHVLPGIGWSLHEAVEYIEKILGKKAKKKTNPKRTYDVEKFIGDPNKLKDVLNNRRFLSLEEGLKIAIPKYLEVMK
jgi:nucleoside-diphosphate-sugar epimerase